MKSFLSRWETTLAMCIAAPSGFALSVCLFKLVGLFGPLIILAAFPLWLVGMGVLHDLQRQKRGGGW
jgi:hypothetical protein